MKERGDGMRWDGMVGAGGRKKQGDERMRGATD